LPTARSLSLNRKYYAAGVASDAVNVTLALIASVLLRFRELSVFPLSEYIGTAAFFFLGYYMTSIVENLYSVRTTLNRPMLLYRAMRMSFVVTGSFVLTVFLFKNTRMVFINSRFVIVSYMFSFLFLTLTAKLLLLPWLFKLIYSGKRSRRSNLLIAGNPEKNSQVAALLRKSIIYATGERIVQWPSHLPVLPEDIARGVSKGMDENRCSGVIVLFDENHSISCIAETSLMLNDMGVPYVIYGPEVFDLGYFDPWFSLSDYGALTFIKKGRRRIITSTGRLSDTLIASLAIVLLSPLLLLTALAVLLSSRGPVLFRQERVGKDLKTFSFLKFRSMKEGEKNTEAHRKYFSEYAQGKTADGDGEGETYKLDQTSRINWVGRIIRKTSIDELPQLLNVVRGEMTLVGPRPCIPYELEHYRGWQRRRFMVKPGLTGIWQVYGRSRLPFDKAQFLDFLYTIDASHSLDFRLLMKTIPVVFFGKGGL